MAIALLQGHSLCVHVVLADGVVWCEAQRTLYVCPRKVVAASGNEAASYLLSVAFCSWVAKAHVQLAPSTVEVAVWLNMEKDYDELTRRAVTAVDYKQTQKRTNK
jgi:hypothetical protein